MPRRFFDEGSDETVGGNPNIAASQGPGSAGQSPTVPYLPPSLSDSIGLGYANQQARFNSDPMQYSGHVPGSEFQSNFGFGARQGPGVDILRTGIGQFGGLQQQGQGVFGQQQGFANYLQQQAMGQGGPSAAQSQFQSGLDQSLRSTMALGQSLPGSSPGAAMRNILEQQGGMAGQANSQAAALRAQEQQRAQGLYGTQLQGMGQFGLGLGQQAMGLAQFGGQLSEQDRQALIELERQRAGVASTQIGAQTAERGQNIGLASGIVGGLLGGAGAAIGKMFGGGGMVGMDPTVMGMGGAGYTAKGGEVPGKAKKQSDSVDNDSVPAMLSPGEIVIPRSVAQDAQAPELAAEFVANIKKHKKAKGGEIHPLSRLPEIRQKLKELQSLLGEQ